MHPSNQHRNHANQIRRPRHALARNVLPTLLDRTRHIPDLGKRVLVRVSPALILHTVRQIIRNLFTINLAHPRHRHIDTSRNTARSEDIAVFDPAR